MESLAPRVALTWFVAASLWAKPLPVDSPAVRFSPATWVGDAGRAGSKSRNTWNNGAWVSLTWSGAATASMSINNPAGGRVSHFIDGQLTDNVAANGTIEVKDLPAGNHEWVLYTRNSPQRKRWNAKGGNRYTVTGSDLPDAATLRPLVRRPWVLIVGDSITELGLRAQARGNGSGALLDRWSRASTIGPDHG